MAKLYGTADSTLVAAAFKHGESMMPGDMKDIYKWKAENFAKFGTGISKMFDEIYADNKNTMDLLNDNATKAINILEAGGMPNDWGIEMHSDVAHGYKDRLKAINAEYGTGKGGDLERSKLRSEMNRYLSNIESGENMFVDMISNAANSRLLNDLGDDKAKLFNLMVEDHNNGTSITKPSYENGEIVYSVPGSDVKLSMREINEGMSAHDPKYLSGIQKKLTSFQAKGKAMGGAMTADDALRFKSELQTSITSWDEIRNVSQEKFGKMKFTFEQVLTGQAKDANGNLDTDLLSHIYEELEALGGIDIDDDGDIDDTDKSLLAQARKNGDIYTGAKASDNGFILIDALKKDKQKYRDVMANYLTETAVKDFYGQGATQFKDKKVTPPTGTLGEREKERQAKNFKAALESIKPTNFQISQELAIKVDPVTKTITEFTRQSPDGQLITAQKAIDLLVKKSGYFNAEEIFGDLSKWNVGEEKEPFRKKGWTESSEEYRKAYDQYKKLP